MDLNSPKDLPLGTILKDSWNGMSDFFEVIGTTEKTVKVRKVMWETCAPDNPDDVDPTTRCVHIKLDEKGNPVPELSYNKEEKIYRKVVKFYKNGGFYIPSIAWNGGHVSIVTDKTQKMIFYWG